MIFQDFSIAEILAGRKRATRRLLAEQPHRRPDGWLGFTKPIGPERVIGVQDLDALTRHAPFQPGDLAWVKESYQVKASQDGAVVTYRDGASRVVRDLKVPVSAVAPKWGNAMFMPRAAGRLSLEITRVRAERLQSITTEEAALEGPCWNHIRDPNPDLDDTHRHYGAKGCFRNHWDSIPRKPRERYQDDPVVWAYGFRVHDCLAKPGTSKA